MASALAYFFWGTTPDAELHKLAASGELIQEDTLVAQARRLLQDDRAKEGMKAFADAWLNYSAVLSVNKDASRYPAFDYSIRSGMARETEDFIDYLVRKKQADFTELFLADYSFGDQRLRIAFKDWDKVFPGAACLTAMIDRLTHHCDILTIQGKSFRHKESSERNSTKKTT